MFINLFFKTDLSWSAAAPSVRSGLPSLDPRQPVGWLCGLRGSRWSPLQCRHPPCTAPCWCVQWWHCGRTKQGYVFKNDVMMTKGSKRVWNERHDLRFATKHSLTSLTSHLRQNNTPHSCHRTQCWSHWRSLDGYGCSSPGFRPWSELKGQKSEA